MTEKFALGIVYQQISPIVLLERNDQYNIYKNNVVEDYMVVYMNGDDSAVSPVFNTIEKAREWSQS